MGWDFDFAEHSLSGDRYNCWIPRVYGRNRYQPDNALGYLTAQTPYTIDNLARQLEVFSVSGTDVTTLVFSIKSTQNVDGGWGKAKILSYEVRFLSIFYKNMTKT